jgi:ArsR family transcriptional regulator
MDRMQKAATPLVAQALMERVAQRFKVLSEPVRLELLDQLHTHGEMNVQQLVEATGHRQANVSKHLHLMTREGLLRRTRAGLHVYYALNDPTIKGLCLLVSGRIRQEVEVEQRALRGG